MMLNEENQLPLIRLRVELSRHYCGLQKSIQKPQKERQKRKNHFAQSFWHHHPTTVRKAAEKKLPFHVSHFHIAIDFFPFFP